MITGWRIVRPEFADDAYSGRGASRDGGRWNSRGVPVAYASASLSVATLELLVNVPATLRLPQYAVVTCHFPEVLVEELDTRRLPGTWRDYPAPAELQVLGDPWLASRAAAVLKVPSAVVPEEFNYLLNPEHPDFRSVDIGQPRPFRLDYRLRT